MTISGPMVVELVARLRTTLETKGQPASHTDIAVLLAGAPGTSDRTRRQAASARLSSAVSGRERVSHWRWEGWLRAAETAGALVSGLETEETQVICRSCGGQLFETDPGLSLEHGSIVWSHWTNATCADPVPLQGASP